MIITPPYYLSGEEGKGLGSARRSLVSLGILDASLSLNSLDVDEMTWSLNPMLHSVMPDPDEWVSLWDDADRRLFIGQVERSQELPSMRYSFTAIGIWQALENTPVKGTTDDRPYRVFPNQDLSLTLRTLLSLAQEDGLRIQPPSEAEMSALYEVPKMALRSQSYADAIIKALEFAPHVSTRLDYTTEPPTLRFVLRSDLHRIDVDSAGHGLLKAKLTAKPRLRARGIRIHYAQRVSASSFVEGVQVAGDLEAEADRQVALILSGQEKTDATAAESLTNSIAALQNSNAALDAVGASATAAAGTATLNVLSFETHKAKNTALSAVASMSPNPSGGVYSYHPNSSKNSDGTETTNTYTIAAPTKVMADGTSATGWYPIKDNAFTSEQLTMAGAQTKNMNVTMVLSYSSIATESWYDGTSGSYPVVPSAIDDLSPKDVRTGYTNLDPYGWPASMASAKRTYAAFYASAITVSAINMSPTDVANAVLANVESQKTTLGDQAEFVVPPQGFAENWLKAQDFVPLEGSLDFSPLLQDKPDVGQHLKIEGTLVDPQWSEGSALIKGVSLDLQTGALSIQAGVPDRQAIDSLLDSIKVPVEDNYA